MLYLGVQESSSTGKNSIAVISMGLFVLLAIGIVVFLYYQNQKLKNILSQYSPTPTPSATFFPTPTAIARSLPLISEPAAGTKVKSPLTVRGIVPAGWVFEGTFPIKLVDSSKKLIVQGTAKENTPGSWQTGEDVPFSTILTFSTTAKWGYIVLQKDNPSGNPINDKTYEQKVYFNCTPRPACLDSNPRCLIPETEDMCPASTPKPQTACTSEAKICPNGKAVGRVPPNCEFAPCTP